MGTSHLLSLLIALDTEEMKHQEMSGNCISRGNSVSVTAAAGTDTPLADTTAASITATTCSQLPKYLNQITFSVNEREWIEANGGGKEMSWEECAKGFQREFQREVGQEILEAMWARWKTECGIFCHGLFQDISKSGNASPEATR